MNRYCIPSWASLVFWVLSLLFSVPAVHAAVRSSEGMPIEGDVYRDLVRLSPTVKIALPPGEWLVSHVFEDDPARGRKALVFVNQDPGSLFKLHVVRYEVRPGLSFGASDCERRTSAAHFAHKLYGTASGQPEVRCSQIFNTTDFRFALTERWKPSNPFWIRAFSKLPQAIVSSLPDDMMHLEQVVTRSGQGRVFTHSWLALRDFGESSTAFRGNVEAGKPSTLDAKVLDWRDRHIDALAKAFFTGVEPAADNQSDGQTKHWSAKAATNKPAVLRSSEGQPKEGDVYRDVVNVSSRLKIALPPGEWAVNHVFDEASPDNRKAYTFLNQDRDSPFKIFVARLENLPSKWPPGSCENRSNGAAFGHSLHGTLSSQLVVKCSQMFPIAALRSNILERWRDNSLWGPVTAKIAPASLDVLPDNLLLIEFTVSQFNGLRGYYHVLLQTGPIGEFSEVFKKNVEAGKSTDLNRYIGNWRDRFVDSTADGLFSGKAAAANALAFNWSLDFRMPSMASNAASTVAVAARPVTDYPVNPATGDAKAARTQRTASLLEELQSTAAKVKLAEEDLARERARDQERLAQARHEQDKLARAQRTAGLLEELQASAAKVKLAEEDLARERARDQERLAQARREQDKLAQAARQQALADASSRDQQRLQAEAAAKQKSLTDQEAQLRAQQRLLQDQRVAEQARLAQEAESLRLTRLALEAKAKEQEKLAQKPAQDLAKLMAEMAQLRAQLQAAQSKPEPALASTNDTAKKPQGPTRRALVMGNDSYQDVTKLLNARADAKAMGAALQKVGFSVTMKNDLTERGMKDAIRSFKNDIRGGDEVVVFFAGHGVQLGAANFLLPVDIRGQSEDQVKDEAIPLQRLLDDIQDSKAKFALAIIDACRDNPFKTAGRAIGGRGLAPTSAASGQMVIFSAGTGQQALDRLNDQDKDPNGLFTRVFLKEMDKPGMPIDRVLRNVRSEVVRLSKSVGHDQVPSLYDQAMGDFFFKP